MRNEEKVFKIELASLAAAHAAAREIGGRMKKITVLFLAIILFTTGILGKESASAVTSSDRAAIGILAIKEVQSAEDYNSAKSDYTETLILTTDAAAENVVDADGDVIVSVATARSELNVSGVATAFRIVSEAQATALASLSGNIDFVLVSSSAELLKSARQQMSFASGVLDMRGKTAESAVELRNLCNANMAKTVILDRETATPEIVGTLRKLLINVWCVCESAEDGYYAASVQCSGVIGSAASAALREIDKLIAKRPLLVAHRGNSGLEKDDGNYYPENSVGAAVQAVRESGADVVEIDIHLSKDGKVVIMHDEDISRTTDDSGKIADRNYVGDLENIKIYDKAGYSSAADDPDAEKIPLLEDFFTAMANDDNVFFIEIKTTGTKGHSLIDAAMAVIEEKGFSARCNFISFYGDQIGYIRNTYPQYSVGILHSGFYGTAYEAMRLSNVYNAGYSPSKASLNTSVCYELFKRGTLVSGWTYVSGDLYEHYAYIDALTADNTALMGDYCREIKPNITKIGGNQGSAVKLKAFAVSYFGNTEAITCEAVKLSGSGELVKSGEKYYYTGTDRVTIALVYKAENANNSNMRLTYISAPVTLSVGTGCSSAAGQQSVALAVAALAAAVVFRRKK